MEHIYNSHRLHRKYSSQDNHIFGHIWTFWIGSTDKIVILIWKLPPILTWQKPSWECWKTTNFLQGIAPNPMDMMGSHLSGPIQHISGWPFTGRDEGNPYIFPSLSVVCLKDFLNFRPRHLCALYNEDPNAFSLLRSQSSPEISLKYLKKIGLDMNGTRAIWLVVSPSWKNIHNHNLELDMGINHCHTKP